MAAFEEIGIDGLHTGPVKKAGGLVGWDPTPSVDGHFDRISTQIDEAFGTEEEFRSMCDVAAGHLGMVIDDIVPGHTGKGADFRLAEMKIGDYPGHLSHGRDRSQGLASVAGGVQGRFGRTSTSRLKINWLSTATSSVGCSG